MSSNISTSFSSFYAEPPSNNHVSRYKKFLSWLSSTWLIQQIGHTWLGKKIAYICSLIRDQFIMVSTRFDRKLFNQLLASLSHSLDPKNAQVSSEDLLKRRDLLLKFISDKWTTFAENLIAQNDEIGEELLSLIKPLATYPFQLPSKRFNDDDDLVNTLGAFCESKPQLNQPLTKDLLAIYMLDEAIESKQNLEHAQKELSVLPTTTLPLKHHIIKEDGLALQLQEEATQQIDEHIPQQLWQTAIDMHLKEYEAFIFHFMQLTRLSFGLSIKRDTEAADALFNQAREDMEQKKKLEKDLEHTKMLKAVVSYLLDPTDKNKATAVELSAPFRLEVTCGINRLIGEFRKTLIQKCQQYLHVHGHLAIKKLTGPDAYKERALDALSIIKIRCDDIKKLETF